MQCRPNLPGLLAGFTKNSSELYQLIFRGRNIPSGRVLVSPDGNYIPFETLVTENQGGKPNYFLFDHATTYTYSFRYFMNDFGNGTSGQNTDFMGMAPVKFPASTNLTSLVGSDLSLKELSAYFSGSVIFTDQKASRRNFVDHFHQYGIIQLYTHASDTSDKREPVIYFADSSLYLSDLISENKPDTRLIVLSACETAGGKLFQGEGVFNFNRAFAALGVPACITNLWAVDNESTYELTQSFYKYLAEGFPTDIALQKAKIDFLRNAKGEKKLPSYWAAPILVGKTDRFIIKKGLSRTALTFIIVIPLAALITLILWNRKKKSITPSPDKGGIAA